MSSILSFVREMGSRKSAKNDAFPEFESKGNIHFSSVLVQKTSDPYYGVSLRN